jgi:hypothetical protein
MTDRGKIATLAATVFAAAVVWTAVAERPESAQRSPWHQFDQMIGPSLVSMEFSRPGVKDRVIWGELVPYGEIWRAGANERTVIEFEDDVLIEGNPLPAGPYGLLVLPEKEEWTFVFSKNFMTHGSDGYSPERDALRVTVNPEAAEHMEWLTYGVTGFEDNAAIVYLHWEKVRAGFRVELANAEN